MKASGNERTSFITGGKRSFFILSTETIEYELSNAIDQAGSGITVASRSSVRCFDEFFSVPSFTLYHSRLAIFADRRADGGYGTPSPSPQKQAL